MKNFLAILATMAMASAASASQTPTANLYECVSLSGHITAYFSTSSFAGDPQFGVNTQYTDIQYSSHFSGAQLVYSQDGDNDYVSAQGDKEGIATTYVLSLPFDYQFAGAEFNTKLTINTMMPALAQNSQLQLAVAASTDEELECKASYVLF